MRCLGRAEVVLWAARPQRHRKDAAVGCLNRQGRIIRRCRMVKIAVLVVQSVQITAVVYCLLEASQSVPAARFLTGGQVVGVAVVISRLSPAVQVEIQPVDAQLVKSCNFFRPDRKGSQMVVFFRSGGVKKVALWVTWVLIPVWTNPAPIRLSTFGLAAAFSDSVRKSPVSRAYWR